jgi:phage tail-like protein
MDSPPLITAPTNILSMAADRYNCYPGELVTLFLRFTLPENKDASLQLSMPRVMEVDSYQMPEGIPSSMLSLLTANQELILQVPLQKPFEARKSYEMSVSVRVKTFPRDQYLLSEAEIYDGETNLLAYEAVQTAVLSKGKYLNHLPELYESDDFVNHFLMLIESFWKPTSLQIEQMDCYFDPLLTPPAVLPWLAGWVGVPVDASLPMDRMRSLLRSAMMFYQRRGTFQALKTYLETYTGGKVTIIERRARNFVLGEKCRLGVDVALGEKNQPNLLQVEINVPREELERSGFSTDMYVRKMKEIVRSLVPAQIIFEVQCEFSDLVEEV